MTNNLLSSLRTASLMALALAVASACTKSKETKSTVDPSYYNSVSSITGVEPGSAMAIQSGTLYHLSHGIEEADSDNTVEATPGMSFDLGLVRARVADEKTLVFEKAYDSQGRPETAKVEVSFPITSLFDIKRDKNDFGDETNKIVEDKTAPWEQRHFMRVDWANPNSTTGTIMSDLVGRLSGYSIAGAGEAAIDRYGRTVATVESTSLLETPTMESNGHFSALMESRIHMKDSAVYTFPMSFRSSESYRVTYRLHLLPVKASDFKPIEYTFNDFSRFGYFFTQQDFQNPKGILESNQKLYANVHNVCEAGRGEPCSTNQIRWVLSKNFPDKYKAIARRVMSEWNQTFQEALNRKDDVVTLDDSKEAEANISDPSKNILAMYTSRTKSGLLGVAQWISDSRTGELNGVRATIYGDGIDYEVGTVDDMINLIVAKNPIEDVFGTSSLGSPAGSVSPYNDKAAVQAFIANRNALGFDQKSLRSSSSNSTLSAQLNTTKRVLSEAPEKASIRMATLGEKSKDVFAIKEMSLLGADAFPKYADFPTSVSGVAIPDLSGLEQTLFAQAKMKQDHAKLLHDAETGIHGTELVEEAAIRYLMNYLKAGHTVAELDKNRAMIEEQIAQETFYTTALHEMGHAFGLRHNFAGSADKKHYAKQYFEIQADLEKPNSQYVKEDLDPFASSSIMDYGRDFYSQRAGLGPYDKAAIKYAYNRSINKESDPIVLAKYSFCTDHQVDESILCRRFDKGANVSEVTQANIEFYNHNFARMHYRRGRISEDNGQGWGSPNALVGSLLSRVFIPTRLVMDEFIYSFITAQKASGDGYCAMKFVKDSVDSGEIADICSNEAMEATHVDPTNLSTFVNALFAYDENGQILGLLKASSDYRPYGFADLLFANMQAQSFFTSVIGAPEPGTYIAMPVKDQSGRQSFQLKVLDPDQPTVEGKLKAFADENGIQSSPEFLKQAAQLVTEVKVGGYGRQLDSVTSVQGGWYRNESLGSFYDKYAAMIALSAEGMPVRKYSTDSMNGNAYFYPQTKPFMTSLFGKLITATPSIASIPVTLAALDKTGNPVVVSAVAPASLNADTQAIATFFAMSELVSETERSMVGKMQICDINQGECSQTADGSDVVQFRSTTGGNIFRATQNSAGDSIAYALVSQAKAIDDQRTKWIAMRDASDKSQADNLMKLDASLVLRDQVITEIKADAELGAMVVGQDNAGKDVHLEDIVQGAWDNMTMLTNVIKQTAQRFTAIGIAQQTADQFGQMATVVDQRIEKLGDAGQCWVKDHPVPLASAVTTAPTIETEITLFSNIGKVLAAQNAPNAPVAVNKAPAPCTAEQSADEANGKVLANLLALKADFVSTNELVKTVITDDVNAIAAPLQINQLNNKLASKETAIDRVHRLVYRATH